MGAQEAEERDIRAIFERLAALHEGMAAELERLKRKAPAFDQPGRKIDLIVGL